MVTDKAIAEEPKRMDEPVAEKSGSESAETAREASSKPPSTLQQEWISGLGTDKTSAVPIQPRKEVDKTHAFGELPSKIDRPIDPNAPTVIVLDDYRYHDVEIKGEHGFSHGEISARMAEENGLNVKRFQVEISKAGAFELGNSMQEIAKRIDSGELKLPEGTALNLSFGLSLTYDQVSSALNMTITPENVKEKREEIVDTLDKMWNNKTLAVNGMALAEAADTNRGIRELQKRGIKVISAAGNEGPDYINIGTLAADVQYSALTADGSLADYSGKNNFTKDGRGQVDFYYQPIDLVDSKPLVEQSGYYAVDGTNIKLPADELGGSRFEKIKGMRSDSTERLDADLARDLNSSSVGQEFDYRRLHEAQFSLKRGEQPATAYGTGKFIVDPREGFTQLTSGDRTAVNPFNVQKLKSMSETKDYSEFRKGNKVEEAHGTSFVNVFMLKDELKK